MPCDRRCTNTPTLSCCPQISGTKSKVNGNFLIHKDALRGPQAKKKARLVSVPKPWSSSLMEVADVGGRETGGSAHCKRRCDALEIYYGRVREIPLAPRPARDVPPSSSPDQPPRPPTATTLPAPPMTRACSQDAARDVKPVSYAYSDHAVTTRVRTAEFPPPPQRFPPGASSPAGDRVDWGKLEAALRKCLRVAHYAYRTEQTYLFWIKRYVAFHDWRKPSALGPMPSARFSVIWPWNAMSPLQHRTRR